MFTSLVEYIYILLLLKRIYAESKEARQSEKSYVMHILKIKLY